MNFHYAKFCTMPIVKVIREELGINSWSMAKVMGRSIQSYLAFERSAKTLKPADLRFLWLVAHQRLGWDADRFFKQLVR